MSSLHDVLDTILYAALLAVGASSSGFFDTIAQPSANPNVAPPVAVSPLLHAPVDEKQPVGATP